MELEECLSILSNSETSSTIPTALVCLVDALTIQKDDFIHRILSWSQSNKVLQTLLDILSWKETRVSGNASFVIGSLLETELGQHRLLPPHGLAAASENRILENLASLLAATSPGEEEVVMNAAGTIGTLLETEAGRQWVVSAKTTLNFMLDQLGSLLTSRHSWISSNSALIIARLSFCAAGCEVLVGHSMWPLLVKNLIESLGSSCLGNGMNAAFALGHFCEIESMRNSLFSLPESLKMLDNLRGMLSCQNEGAKRNAAYGLSCALASNEGQKLMLKLSNINKLFVDISCLLTGSDAEAAWFSALALYALANNPTMRKMLKKSSQAMEQLKGAAKNLGVAEEVKAEVELILQLLEDLRRPPPPTLSVDGSYCVESSWPPLASHLPITYELRKGSETVYSGSECQYTVSSLLPNAKYSFKLRYFNGCSYSQFSEEASVVTAENLPTAPQCLVIAGQTQTQVRLAWQQPQVVNGTLKGYTISQDGTQVHCTRASRQSCIISGLQPSSRHKFEVMAITSNGYGDPSVIYGGPLAAGDHCPPKPQLTVLGRHEIFVTFLPPPQPLGQIRKYELKVDGRVVYTGTNMQYKCKRLTPDTEYVFTVCALTSEGRSESAPAKKRTGRDFFPAKANLTSGSGLSGRFGRGVRSSMRLQSSSGVLSSPSSSNVGGGEGTSTLFRSRSRPRSASLRRSSSRRRGSSRVRSASLDRPDKSPGSSQRPKTRAYTAKKKSRTSSSEPKRRELKSSQGADRNPTRDWRRRQLCRGEVDTTASGEGDDVTMTVSVTCLPQQRCKSRNNFNSSRRPEKESFGGVFTPTPPLGLKLHKTSRHQSVTGLRPRAASEPASASVLRSCYSILSHVPRVPPPEYRARPLPIHVRQRQSAKTHFHTSAVDELKRPSSYVRSGRVVTGPVLTVKDIMWGMKQCRLNQRSMTAGLCHVTKL